MHVPVLSLIVTPKTDADQERLRVGLAALMAEDPTIGIKPGPQASDVTIAATGELQLEIIIGRLYQEFGVEGSVGKPQVIYSSHEPGTGAKPVLLEPVMRVEVLVAREYVGDVKGNLSSRRAKIESQEDRGGSTAIRASVPMSQMFGYACDLRERTLGRATFTSKFDHYEPVSADPDQGDDRNSYVGWPNSPKRPLKSSTIALPEPD